MFCLGQGIFWILVGSKQFENVVKDKVEIAKLFLDHDSNSSLKVSLCKEIKTSVTSQDVENIKRTEEENIQMVKNRFWGFFSITASVFVVTLASVLYQFGKKYDEATSASDTSTTSSQISLILAKRKGFFWGLFLVLFSFSTEIFIFKFIIEPYIIIGDMEMLSEMI